MSASALCWTMELVSIILIGDWWLMAMTTRQLVTSVWLIMDCDRVMQSVALRQGGSTHCATLQIN